MPEIKRFQCMKLVESIMVRISVMTNNLCYPRISKKLMFCETSDKYLVANIITSSRHYEIQNIGYLKCFVSPLGLKMDVLHTNSCDTHEFNLHDTLK